MTAQTKHTAGRADPYPLYRWCHACGWAKGGKDSWNGRACKCGFTFSGPVKAVRS